MASNDYPPQFAQSALASVFGQINDLAGPVAPSNGATSNVAGAPKLGAVTPERSIPVEITGGADPSKHIPGLREILIGVSIQQLLTQLPPDVAGDKLGSSADELIDAGIKKLQSRGKPRPVGAKAKKK